MADLNLQNSKHRGVLFEKDGTDVVGRAEETLSVALSDETSDLTTGTAIEFRMPFALTLTEARINSNTAPSGVAIIVDVFEAGVSIFSTRPAIEVGDTSSEDGAYPGTISGPSLADNAVIRVDVDQVGSGTPGSGLKLILNGTRA